MSIYTVNARIPGSQNDTRISVQMPEFRLSNSISDHCFNISVVLFLMLNSNAHGSLLMFTYILFLIMSFKMYCHVSYVCVCVPYVIDPVILFYTQGRTGKVVSGQDHLTAYQV